MKFKLLTLMAAFGFSALANASTNLAPRYQKAWLNLCPAEAVGCVQSIDLEGKTYPFEVDPKATRAQRLVEKMIAVHQILELPNTSPFLTRGYFVLKGHLPNPTIEQLVFVITDVDGVVIPRSLE